MHGVKNPDCSTNKTELDLSKLLPEQIVGIAENSSNRPEGGGKDTHNDTHTHAHIRD